MYMYICITYHECLYICVFVVRGCVYEVWRYTERTQDKDIILSQGKHTDVACFTGFKYSITFQLYNTKLQFSMKGKELYTFTWTIGLDMR